MKNRGDRTELSKRESEEISPLRIIKTEANLAGLPFFALSRQEIRTRFKTEYNVSVEREGEKLDVLWKVSANHDYGYPGPFDRKVHKAIEHITNQRGIPVVNPIPFSIYELCKLIGIANSGTNKRRATTAVRRIVATTVDSEGAFFSKKEKRYITDTFHIYDRVVFKGRELASGEIAETNYLFLSQWYLDSINSFYVKPIDFTYLRQLRSDIAGRLYELLGLKFHGVIRNKRAHWRVEYKELCDLLPITPQKYLSNAKRYLEPAHTELIRTHFLAKVEWDAGDHGYWYILYYPGKRAMDEAKPKAVQEELPLEVPEQTPGIRNGPDRALAACALLEDEDTAQCTPTGQNERSTAPSKLTSEEQELFSSLRQRRIGEKSAWAMVKTYPERIREKIEMYDWAMRNIREKVQSPTGFLRRMIEEDWDAPEGFVSEAEQESTQEETRRRTKAQERKEQEEQYRAWCLLTPPQKVRGALWLWEHRFAREQGRKPTVEETRKKERELILGLPSEEEYRQRLFGKS